MKKLIFLLFLAFIALSSFVVTKLGSVGFGTNTSTANDPNGHKFFWDTNDKKCYLNEADAWYNPYTTFIRWGTNTLLQNSSINGTFDLRVGNTNALDTIQHKAGTVLLEGATNGVQAVSNLRALKRVLGAKGANVASAGLVTLGDGNFFHVTGTTTLNEMTETNWTNGSQVTLWFEAALTITHDATSTGATPFWIESGSNLSVSANTGHTFILDGSYWRQID